MTQTMEYIDTYTREDAINDGVLHDVTLQAKEAGIKYPVALTMGVIGLVNNKPSHEDIEGRIWDIVWMLRCAISGTIKAEKPNQSTVIYSLILNNRNASPNEPEMVTLKALIHPGDNLEPVITVMQENEKGVL